MSGQHMPARVASYDPGKLILTPFGPAFAANPPSVVYIRADIAERMAEALERCAEARMPGEARRIAREALAAFKEATR